MIAPTVVTPDAAACFKHQQRQFHKKLSSLRASNPNSLKMLGLVAKHAELHSHMESVRQVDMRTHLPLIGRK